MGELILPGANAGAIITANSAEGAALFGGGLDRSEMFAGVQASDILMPRLKLAQASDSNVKNPANKLVNGDYYNQSTLEKVFDAATGGWVVPIYFYKEMIEWNIDKKAEKNKKIIAKTTDYNSVEGRKMAWHVANRTKVTDSKGKSVNKITEYIHFLVVVPDISWTTPFQLSFYRSNYKVGKQLLNRAMNAVYITPDGGKIAGAPLYSMAYHLRSDVELNTDGEDYQISQIGQSVSNPPEVLADLRRQYEEARKAMQSGALAVSPEDGDAADAEVVQATVVDVSKSEV